MNEPKSVKLLSTLLVEDCRIHRYSPRSNVPDTQKQQHNCRSANTALQPSAIVDLDLSCVFPEHVFVSRVH